MTFYVSGGHIPGEKSVQLTEDEMLAVYADKFCSNTVVVKANGRAVE